MSSLTPSQRYRRRPDHGGDLQSEHTQRNWGWPLCPDQVAQRWYTARMRPWGHVYRDVWYRYLADGLVNEPSAGELEAANAGWTACDPSYGHSALDRDSPWTLVDSLGAGIEYAGAAKVGAQGSAIEIADSYGFGWVLTYYWQIDIAKMVRRIRGKLDTRATT